MEEPLIFVSLLSLKQISMRRVIVNLWNDTDILSSIEQLSTAHDGIYGKYSLEWRINIDSQVRRNLSKLVLPTTLKERILLLITPIGLEIKAWKEFHEHYLEIPDHEAIFKKNFIDSQAKFNALILSKLFWTTTGTVDYRKTAEELIRCKLLDVVKRYQLACLYCLEGSIPRLWEELPEEIKGIFYNEENMSEIVRLNLSYYWPFILKGEHFKLDCIAKNYKGDIIEISFDLLAFSISLHSGNKAALEYFTRIINNDKKRFPVVVAINCIEMYQDLRLKYNLKKFPFSKGTDVLCYLLSRMTRIRQMNNFLRQPSIMLLRFMSWHLQDIFESFSEVVWPLVFSEDSKAILQTMYDHFRDTQYYFPQSFQHFFTHSPISFRKAFVDGECQSGKFFSLIFYLHDAQTIKVILRNIDIEDRVILVTSEPIFTLLYSCIWGERYHLVKEFLRGATLSNEDTDTVMKAFSRYFSRTPEGVFRRQTEQRFLQILHNSSTTVQRK